jgi:hypothetical protein
MRWFRIAVAGVFLLAPGLALGRVWMELGNPPVVVPSGIRTRVNKTIAVLFTAGYLYFVSALVLIFSPWRQSFTHWWLYRQAIAFVGADLLVGLAGAAIAFLGRGIARRRIIVTGLLLTLMSFAILFGMAAD